MPKTVSTDDLYHVACALLHQPGRQFLAIVGAPGSGKSTTAEALLEMFEAEHNGRCALLAMDGFHYNDEVLRSAGKLDRKGAPDTFDVGGLQSVLRRLKARDELAVAVPVFCRKREISLGSAKLIPSEVDLIIVEGNYLLLNYKPWSTLHPFFDLTCMIEVTEEVLAERLRRRGYGLQDQQIQLKLEHNDLPNGALVRNQSVPTDLVLRQ